MIRRLIADRTAQCLLLAAAILGWCRAPWTSSPPDDRFYYYQKLTWRQNTDVVILGDSRPMLGLSPKVMAADLQDHRIRNFSFSAVGYSADYLTAAEQVWDNEQGVARIALLGITPRSLRAISLKSNRFISASKTYTPQAYWKARWLGWVDHVWPPMDRPFLESLVRGTQPGDVHLHRDADGWFEPCHQKGELANTISHYRHVRNDPIRQEIVDQLLDRVRKWSARGIHVYGFRPPTCPEMEALEDDFAEASFARAFEAAGGRWITPPSDDLATYDASHLDIDSVRLYSQRVAQTVSTLEKYRNVQQYRDYDFSRPQVQATASLDDAEMHPSLSLFEGSGRVP